MASSTPLTNAGLCSVENSLANLDGFVDDDFWGRGAVGQFPNGQAEDAAIDARLTPRGPLRGDALDPGVDRFELAPGSLGHLKAPHADGFVRVAMLGRFPAEFEIEIGVGVPKEEDLHGQFAGFAHGLHLGLV